MEPRSLNYLSQSCGGTLEGPAELQVTDLSTDTRKIGAGSLFVALGGERFDGHDFVGSAFAQGAAGAVVARDRMAEFRSLGALIGVDDPRRALGQMAARYRADFELPIIAVAGSNGKTSTKDMIAATLGGRMRTHRSAASFNNDVGVPLTLLGLGREHQAAVFEIGTNHPGELGVLIPLVGPRYGVITNIGREHLEFFKDLRGVAEEEGTLAEMLPAEGCLFVNGDSPEMADVIRRATARVVTSGFGAHNDWRATEVRMDARGSHFDVVGPDPDYCGTYRVNILGRHQVANALLAILVGRELGLGAEDIRSGLAACVPASMRMQASEMGGISVINDCYNANADSMAAALDTLAELPCAGRRLLVMGDMAELGEHSAAAHRETGRRAAEAAIDGLLAVGSHAALAVEAAAAAGLTGASLYADNDALVAALLDQVQPGDVILFKASRSTRLESVVREVTEMLADREGRVA